MVQPVDFSIRSFHYRALSTAGARFAELGGAAMATDYGADSDKEKAQAQKLGLADLSTLPRTGFKGREAIAWLGLDSVAGIALALSVQTVFFDAS